MPDNIVPFAPRRPEPEQDHPGPRQPLINLPPFTKILLLILIAIQIGISLLPEPEQYAVMARFGFIPAYYSAAIPFAWPALIGPLTFTFIHGGWAHLGMNGLMLAAFGSGLERWMGWRRMALLMLACNVVAALIQFAVDPASADPVIGASGALSGLFAAAILMMQSRGNAMPLGRYGYWPLIAIWVLSSAAFGIIGGPQGQAIAWPAHIGGFLAGFALTKPVMRLRI